MIPAHEFLFPARSSGAAGHPHSFTAWLKDFVRANGLPHISPHALRHMAATFLITAGTDIRTVSGKLDHSQTSTTMNIYSHLLKSAEQETANTIGNVLQQATEKAKEAQKSRPNNRPAPCFLLVYSCPHWRSFSPLCHQYCHHIHIK